MISPKGYWNIFPARPAENVVSMAQASQHIFQLESELQNIPEAAPKASPSFSTAGP
jgi:hypothetical protein